MLLPIPTPNHSKALWSVFLPNTRPKENGQFDPSTMGPHFQLPWLRVKPELPFVSATAMNPGAPNSRRD